MKRTKFRTLSVVTPFLIVCLAFSLQNCTVGRCLNEMKIAAPVSVKPGAVTVTPTAKFGFVCCPDEEDKKLADQIKKSLESAYKALLAKFVKGTAKESDFEQYTKLVEATLPTLNAVLQCDAETKSPTTDEKKPPADGGNK